MSNEPIGATNNRFIGLSTDTKPTSVNTGATYFEQNTGFMFIYNGYAWVPKSFMPESTVNYKQISLDQAAGASASAFKPEKGGRTSWQFNLLVR